MTDIGTTRPPRMVFAIAAVLGLAGSALATASVAEAGTVRPAAETTFYRAEILNSYGSLCLDAENAGGHNPAQSGDKVQLWTCKGTANQLWTYNANGTITNDYAGLCLDAEDTSITNPSDNGDIVQLWSCNGGPNQVWDPYIGINAVVTGELISNYDELVLDAETDQYGNPDIPGDTVQLWSSNGGKQQQWYTPEEIM